MKNKREEIPKTIKKALKDVCPKNKGKVFGIQVYEYGGVPDNQIWIFTKHTWYKLDY